MFNSKTMFSFSSFENGLCSKPTVAHGGMYFSTSAEVAVTADALISSTVDHVADQGVIRYVFQIMDRRNPGYMASPFASLNGDRIQHGLSVSKHVSPIGTINNSELSTALSSVFKKTLPMHGDATFDMRALMYLCGYLVAFNATPMDFTLPDVGHDFLLHSLHTTTLGSLENQFIITNIMARNAAEYGTLLTMLGYLGVNNPLTAQENMYGHLDKLTGISLAAYALRLSSLVYNQAIVTQTGTQHALAFLRGMSRAVTLLAHSDEGGFTRELLQTATYPPPSGTVVVLNQVPFLGVPPDIKLSTINTKSILAAFTAENLLLLGTMATCSDPGFKLEEYDVCLPFITLSDRSHPTRPGDWNGLREATLTWATNLQFNMQRYLKLDTLIINDKQSYLGMFSHNAVNRHLTIEGVELDSENTFQYGLFPFFWIEPAPFMKRFNLETEYFSPSGEIPIIKYDKIARSNGYGETSNGRPIRGSHYLLQPSMGQTFRSMGISYLYSQQMNPKDGLADIKIVSTDGIRARFEPFGNCSEKAEDLAQARWVTPDNCLPHPGHGWTSGHQLVNFIATPRNAVQYPSASWVEKSPTIRLQFSQIVVNDSHSLRAQRYKPNDKYLSRPVKKFLSRDNWISDYDEMTKLTAQFTSSARVGQKVATPLDLHVDRTNDVAVDALGEPTFTTLPVRMSGGDVSIRKYTETLTTSASVLSERLTSDERTQDKGLGGEEGTKEKHKNKNKNYKNKTAATDYTISEERDTRGEDSADTASQYPETSIGNMIRQLTMSAEVTDTPDHGGTEVHNLTGN